MSDKPKFSVGQLVDIVEDHNGDVGRVVVVSDLRDITDADDHVVYQGFFYGVKYLNRSIGDDVEDLYAENDLRRHVECDSEWTPS